MNNKLDRLKDIKVENYIWVIYIVIIFFSWIANSKEKDYIITNNFKSKQDYQTIMILIFSILIIVYLYFTLDSYEDVLIKTRDMVYNRHILLTHPQASSLKPNQTPYRSVVVYPKGEEDNMKDIMLIEKCIETYRQWQEIAPTPKNYAEKVANDFKTIDLSVIENIIPRIS